MSIIHHFDKRSGLTYVYESTSYWDKEKKQPRSHRVLIGRLDPATGEVVKTDGRGRRRGQVKKATNTESSNKPGRVPWPTTRRLFFGTTYLFDQIGEAIGITNDLKKCFPQYYKQILSIAYYLILEDRNPLSRFHNWSLLHRHPFGEDISSQRTSELFGSISEEAKMNFFRLQGKRRLENEYWAYDTTSISSRSELLKQVQYGRNKDGDSLGQINLALLFGQESGLPFYYRKLAGNIPDVKTIRELLKELDVLGYSHVKLIMDRGFYSADNINNLYKHHLKFLIGTSTALSFAKSFIREVADKKDSFEAYNENYELYIFTKTICWDYEENRPYKKDTVSGERRLYLHLYYNPDKAANDAKVFNRKLSELKAELLSGKRVPEHEADYERYFTVTKTPKRGIGIAYNQEAIDKKRERYGFFTLISNEIKDPVRALELYRSRNIIERAYFDIKGRLNMRRTLVSSDSSLEGKCFVEFVALIFLSYIKQKMEEKNLFKQYTLQELLDELDRIECFIEPGKSPIQGEVLLRQEQLYRDLGVKPLLANPLSAGD